MFGYDYDPETGGILLNDSTPNSSKEPRPVYAGEMKLLGMDEWFGFDTQNERPYMWAESANYFYRGRLVARTRGGTLCEAPVMDYLVGSDFEGKPVPGLARHTALEPVDIEGMVEKNADFMSMIEQITLKRIYDYWKRYKDRIDNFHVAFSGGKDSLVLLDLTQRALPHGAFIVIFGDTGMEFPDTYKLVDLVERQCKAEGIAFYRAASHLKPEESWRLFGPPSQTLRWCCSVHKSTPQTLKLREILKKENYTGADFVGVRCHESLRRSEYNFECYGKKQKGQYSHNPILDWTSAEVWLYTYVHGLPVNETYKKGNARAGCLLCPMGHKRSDAMRALAYPDEINRFTNIIRDMIEDKNIDSYICNSGWLSRKNGRDLTNNTIRYIEKEKGDKIEITLINPRSDWREWIKTIEPLPFFYHPRYEDGALIVSLPVEYNKTYIGKLFKQVFRKAAYCVGCRVCEANCVNGCIDFANGLKINDCHHCMKCHDVDDGCLLYHSVVIPKNGGHTVNKNSINSYADHAPKPEWIHDFFERGNDFIADNTLGPLQISNFKKFLTNAMLINKGKTTEFYDIAKGLGEHSPEAWGLIYTNLVYNNAQMRWYVDNMSIDESVSRPELQMKLQNDGVSVKDSRSIVKAFKRLSEIPLGTSLKFGVTSGENIDVLTRTKCNVHDGRVLLYALYRFAGACDDYCQFNLARLLNTTTESAGVTPAKLFGLGEEDMIPMLKGLSARYPDFINASFTHGLDKVSLREDKTAADVLQLFRESETL